MNFNQEWKNKPQKGYEFIYRYYDAEGKSYIGHTKQSLCSRAGGKKGTNYTRQSSKFQEAILKIGFENFEFQILEEVPQSLGERKEKFYIEQFDSRKNGYNSTNGGRVYYENIGYQDPFRKKGQIAVINLNDYNAMQLDNLLSNLILFLGASFNLLHKTNIDQVLKDCENRQSYGYSYTYYLGEEPYQKIYCHPVVLAFNFIDIMISQKWKSSQQNEDQRICNEIFGGDILTSGVYAVLNIVLLDQSTISFDI